MGWLLEQRDQLYAGLDELSFDEAMGELERFEGTLFSEKEQLDSSDADTDTRKRRMRLLTCELSVLYEKMALQCLNSGQEELHIEYTRKSKDELAGCASLR